MRTLVALALTAVVLPALAAPALAQPEDRRRSPTAPSASVETCYDGADDRLRTPSASWPGFDPRVPAPAGATSFTGIAPPGRDPSRGFPEPPQPNVTAQACTQRLSR